MVAVANLFVWTAVLSAYDTALNDLSDASIDTSVELDEEKITGAAEPLVEIAEIEEAAIEEETVSVDEELITYEEEPVRQQKTSSTGVVRTVPFYSQFTDISAPEWKKIGCGIASLAMLIEYYEPGTVSVDTLLQQGIASGAYLTNAGWIHRGLADLSNRYGLEGQSFDYSTLSMDSAFSKLSAAIEEGPVIASVFYTFDPQSPIPHLVVVNSIQDDVVYYNDPSEGGGGGTISIAKFKKAWKKRYIEVRALS